MENPCISAFLHIQNMQNMRIYSIKQAKGDQSRRRFADGAPWAGGPGLGSGAGGASLDAEPRSGGGSLEAEVWRLFICGFAASQSRQLSLHLSAERGGNPIPHHTFGDARCRNFTASYLRSLHSAAYFLLTLLPSTFHVSGRDDLHFQEKRRAQSAGRRALVRRRRSMGGETLIKSAAGSPASRREHDTASQLSTWPRAHDTNVKIPFISPPI